MLIEDQFLICEMLTMRLEAAGFNVLQPCPVSGEEALATLASCGTTPDIILIDFQLEGELDGVQTACKIRENYPHVFLGITSGLVDSSLETSVADIPDAVVIDKTALLENIIPLISRLLSRGVW